MTTRGEVVGWKPGVTVWWRVQDRGGGGEVQDSAGLLLRDLVRGGQRVGIRWAHISKRGSESVQVRAVQVVVLGGAWL